MRVYEENVQEGDWRSVCVCLFCVLVSVLVSVGVRKGRLQGKIKGYIAVMLFKHR